MSEANWNRSRANCRVLAETTILRNGLVSLESIVADVTVSTSAAGNTGNATIVAANPATTTKAKNGVYRGVALTATTVRWENPDGVEIGQSTHGTAFNKEIKFTITAGGTPNVVGDVFTFTVANDIVDSVVKPWVAGEEVFGYSPYGIVTGVGETGKEIAVLKQECMLNANCIQWPAGVTTGEKQAAATSATKRQIELRF